MTEESRLAVMEREVQLMRSLLILLQSQHKQRALAPFLEQTND